MTIRLAYFVATCRRAFAGICGASAFSNRSTSARVTTVLQSADLAASAVALSQTFLMVMTGASGGTCAASEAFAEGPVVSAFGAAGFCGVAGFGLEVCPQAKAHNNKIGRASCRER